VTHLDQVSNLERRATGRCVGDRPRSLLLHLCVVVLHMRQPSAFVQRDTSQQQSACSTRKMSATINICPTRYLSRNQHTSVYVWQEILGVFMRGVVRVCVCACANTRFRESAGHALFSWTGAPLTGECTKHTINRARTPRTPSTGRVHHHQPGTGRRGHHRQLGEGTTHRHQPGQVWHNARVNNHLDLGLGTCTFRLGRGTIRQIKHHVLSTK
jgi:hypothetical protein